MIAGSGFIFFALLKILSKFCWFSFVCRRLSCLSFVNDSRVGLCDWFDVWIEAEALMKSLNFPIRLRHRFESCCVARDFANLDAVWRRISTEDWLRVTWRQRNESFVIRFVTRMTTICGADSTKVVTEIADRLTATSTASYRQAMAHSQTLRRWRCRRRYQWSGQRRWRSRSNDNDDAKSTKKQWELIKI